MIAAAVAASTRPHRSLATAAACLTEASASISCG
jgi:hypothetical protein